MATHTANHPGISIPDRTEKINLRRWLPSILWILAAALLVASVVYPYWGMVLHAPQYPGGLQMRVFVNRMTGDEDPKLDEVHEIDGLNHYIGMRSLYEAASLERKLAIPSIIAFVAMLALAALWRRRWTWLLAVPPLMFPFVFLGDLAFWMNHYGQNLDPSAPLSSAIKPFTPPILGQGVIGQFKTVAYVDTGWYLAAGAAALILIAILFRLWMSRNEKGAHA